MLFVSGGDLGIIGSWVFFLGFVFIELWKYIFGGNQYLELKERTI
jgi:hypothetical protein